MKRISSALIYLVLVLISAVFSIFLCLVFTKLFSLEKKQVIIY